MKQSDAARIVAYLTAAYPETALEQESVEVYVRAVQRLKEVKAAEAAVEAIVLHESRFPSLAVIHREYPVHLRNLHALDKPPPAPELEPGPRELPAVVLEHLDKLAGTDSEAQKLSGFEDAGLGRCEECGTEGSLLVYVLLRLCRRCVVRRLRAAEKVSA